MQGLGSKVKGYEFTVEDLGLLRFKAIKGSGSRVWNEEKTS